MRFVCGAAVGLIVLGAVAGCQHLNFSRGERAPEKPPSCLGSVEEFNKKKFELDGALEDRVRAAFGGVLELEVTAMKLDERLTTTCESLARELGAKPAPPKRDAEEAETAEGSGSVAEIDTKLSSEGACQTAMAELKAFKEKHKVAMSLTMTPFSCGARIDDFEACARRCDTSLPPGKLEISCEAEQQRGRCSGKCTGQCAEINTTECAATCQGECNGSCSKGFYGKCGGKCIGTCDMADVNGKCAGLCDGKCLSEAKGTCEGKCAGKCVGACLAESRAKSCDGTCRGQCDVAMTAPVCGDVYPPPEMSHGCVARCTAATASKLQCSVDHVGISVIRAEKESDGLRLRNMLTGRSRDIAEVGEGMKPRLDNAATRVEEALDAVELELQNNAAAAGNVGRCLTEAVERHAASVSAFAKFSELSAAFLQTVRE
jgi:hypothetical protein